MEQIHLEKVCWDNYYKLTRLGVKKEQSNFVASNATSLIHAYLALSEGEIMPYPFGIYLGEKPIGFIMIGYNGYEDGDPEFMKDTYVIWRFMIDRRYQGKGYGRQAFQLALDFIRTFPKGPSELCWLSYEPENAVAKKLYASFGFEEVPEFYKEGEEMPAILKLKNDKMKNQNRKEVSPNMKAPFSPYLDALAPKMKQLVELLGRSFAYVSILSTDSVGFSVYVSQTDKGISGQNMTTERGNVVRVWRDGQYSEYAFNEITGSVEALAEEIVCQLERQFELLKLTGTKAYDTLILPDEPLELFEEKETGELPEQADMKKQVESFTALSDRGMEIIPHALDCSISGSSTHISKMFVTKNRFLRQSYVYAEGSCWAIASNNEDETKEAYQGVSGCGGPEILDGLKDVLEKMPKLMEQMLASEEIEPGEYEIITDPETSGLIAHEAFGHGVEMDMFVKHRALGADYIGKRVGSELCTMHEGALCDNSVTAYVFDDEGVLAGDVTEIDHGILKTGICDALAALRLGVQPTGNGKRENFAHKVYTRMTNTIFDSGDSTLDEMIASIKFGYLLEGEQSGMEDPKHWGIQCIICRGYEIKDGALTGKVVAPVVMTGYVPDLLGSISMASRDRGVTGNGGCGKGYKEWVKVAAGGPYLKMKARLG